MLGIIRFFLASCVIVYHLSAKTPGLGLYAVNCFYVISGYLITLILNKNYSFKFKPFVINRFLRLYPTYWFCAAVGLIFISIIPDANNFHPSYGIGSSFMEVTSNVLLIPWAFFSDSIVVSPFYVFGSPDILNFNGYMFRVVTSSWSVAVEIVCYFTLWLFVARKASFAIITLIASCIYHWYAINHTDNIFVVYSPVFAALLPFSIGSIGYFLSDHIEKRKPSLGKAFGHQLIFLMVFILAFLINLELAVKNGELLPSIYYYVNNIIALFAIMSLHGAKLPEKFKGLGSLLGNMAYPIFLCQFYFGLIAWYIIGEPSYNRGWDIFTIGYCLSLVFSFVCVKLIDNPISKIRDKVRPSK